MNIPNNSSTEDVPPNANQAETNPPATTVTSGASPFTTSPDSAENNKDSSQNDYVEFPGMLFNDQSICHAFIKKVYLILTCQLVVTVGFVAFFLFYSPARLWVQGNPWFYYVSYAEFGVTAFVLFWWPSIRRKWPTNFIGLAIFTLSLTYVTETISSYHDTKIILIAFGITAAFCLSTSVFAMQTKIDITMRNSILFALLMVIIFFGFASIIVFVAGGSSEILQALFGALIAGPLAVLLAYNTQKLLGEAELSPEEYIFAALQLYLDVVEIFLEIMSYIRGD